MPPRKYRIALLVDGVAVPKWVRDLADWANDHAAFDLVAVVVEPPNGGRGGDKLLKLERRLLSLRAEYRAYAKSYSIAGCAPHQISADLHAIKELELDAIVRCGGAASSGAILKAARDGVVSVVAGAGDFGSRPGFAEILAGRPDTPFTIERLHDEGEPREVLFSGSVATALLYAWNYVSLHARAYTYLQRTLEALAAGAPRRNEIQREDGCSQADASGLLAYGLKTAQRSVAKGVRRYARREFNWQVAFTRRSAADCELGQGTVVPNPPGAFLADPFTIKVDGIDYLFVEEFPFDTRKGVISAYRLEGAQAVRIGVALETPYHLSFPFLFEHAGDIYMVPESGADRSIRLYKATNFPLGWSEVKVLMSDVPAVDTVVFEHDSLWWMLTTIQGDGPGLNNCELHAFYADDPLGEWKPHRHNPVVMNAIKGRNGGFVRDDQGRPCRVAQVPGFTFYGAGSSIYRIDELTPDAYRETLIREVRPDFFPKLDGTHHIHSVDGITVYDFMRVERPGAARAA